MQSGRFAFFLKVGKVDGIATVRALDHAVVERRTAVAHCRVERTVGGRHGQNRVAGFGQVLDGSIQSGNNSAGKTISSGATAQPNRRSIQRETAACVSSPSTL